jgi:CheY-like chemotaxis protein
VSHTITTRQTDRHPPAQTGARAVQTDKTTEAVWPSRVVLICARFGGELDPVTEWVEGMGGSTVIVGEGLLPFEWLDQYAATFDLALFDCDHVGDQGDVIDFGLRLRRYAPDMPVIMVSSRVAAHDFSAERMAICDVTLKKPVTRSAFFLALQAALDNHAHWQMRDDTTRVVWPKAPPAPAE